LINFVDQALEIFLVMFHIPFQLVHEPLEVIPLGLLLGNTLVFGGPFMFDLFHGGV